MTSLSSGGGDGGDDGGGGCCFSGKGSSDQGAGPGAGAAPIMTSLCSGGGDGCCSGMKPCSREKRGRAALTPTSCHRTNPSLTLTPPRGAVCHCGDNEREGEGVGISRGRWR